MSFAYLLFHTHASSVLKLPKDASIFLIANITPDFQQAKEN